MLLVWREIQVTLVLLATRELLVLREQRVKPARQGLVEQMV